MFGKRVFCLLAVLLVVLAPIVSFGQTSSAPSSSERALSDFYDSLSRGPDANPPGWRPILPPRVPVTPPVGFGFPQIARAAGMIFSGTVTKIERRPATGGQSVETVAITFHVEDAIRGATPGENLTISQWIGLWSAGQRYRVGERLLLFFYPRSKLKLTSCVGGSMGRFAVDSWGRVWLTAQHLGAFQKDPVLGGKSRVRISDFALAVRRAGEEE